VRARKLLIQAHGVLLLLLLLLLHHSMVHVQA
jgi:hypothetical protein